MSVIDRVRTDALLSPLAHAREAFMALSDTDRSRSDATLQGALLDLLCCVVDAFDADGQSAEAYEAIGTLSPEQADLAFDLLAMALFQGDVVNIAALDDAALLTTVALRLAAGRLDDAAAILAGTVAQRPAASFQRAAFTARCRVYGHNEGIAGLWLNSEIPAGDLATARARVAAHPMDIFAHAALARRLAE